MSEPSLPVRLRTARGSMDLATAADRSGIPDERIREYESGERRPYMKTLRRLAAVYGVPLEQLAPSGTASLETSRRGRDSRFRRRPRQSAWAGSPVRTTITPKVGGGDAVVRIVIEVRIEGGDGVEVEVTPGEGDVGARSSVAAAQRSAAETSPAHTPAHASADDEAEAGSGDPISSMRRAYLEFRRGNG